MKAFFSRFGGNALIIGEGKASASGLPEDQSLDNMLDHHSEELIPNVFVISSYDIKPEFMGAMDRLPSKAHKIGTIVHVFTEIILQYDMEVETDIYVTNGLAAKVGGRFEHSSYLQKANFAPRLSLAYRTGQYGQASLAYGIFHQNPERKYLPGNGNLIFSTATHYIAQYLRTNDRTTLRAEVFYKKYRGLVKTIGTNGAETAVGNEGYGDAKGVEFFWRDKKSVKDLDYWISYSFLDTKRDFLNFPFAIQPNFAARHTASFVAKKFVSKMKSNFNISYNYASGRPYYFIGKNDQTGKPEFRDRGQTIPYHNVSLSVNYLPNIGSRDSKVFGVYVFSVSNVFNFDQVFGYQYAYNGYRKEAIVPPAKMFLFLGAFLSFGVDRTGDVINSNL